jgi:hypothetical protein
MIPSLEIGSTQVCAETGKPFVIASDGSTFNHAMRRLPDGTYVLVSDVGVDLVERRELLDRSKPFGCYLSQDGARLTSWKGNALATVTRSSESRTGFHGSRLTHVHAIDVHGGHWFGKGSGRGMSIIIRACKG